VGGNWRRLHNDELHDLYCGTVPTVTRLTTLRGQWPCKCMGDTRSARGMLVGRREGMRPLGRHRSRWKENIKEVGREATDSIRLKNGGSVALL
jgi:hypothetical protein